MMITWITSGVFWKNAMYARHARVIHLRCVAMSSPTATPMISAKISEKNETLTVITKPAMTSSRASYSSSQRFAPKIFWNPLKKSMRFAPPSWGSAPDPGRGTVSPCTPPPGPRDARPVVLRSRPGKPLVQGRRGRASFLDRGQCRRLLYPATRAARCAARCPLQPSLRCDGPRPGGRGPLPMGASAPEGPGEAAASPHHSFAATCAAQRRAFPAAQRREKRTRT